MVTEEKYMVRCLQLAKKGSGFTKTNPMVGAVLVYNNQIIGEGWHRVFGGPHAEANCIENVPAAKKQFIPEATLYVSLEPCNHSGKTPACTNLILKHAIKKVVIGCTDPNTTVAGNGIAFLQQNGVAVVTGILEAACKALNAIFFTNQYYKLPYIVLKFAQSKDGFIAGEKGRRIFISNAITARYVHQLRSKLDAILVGSQTVKFDDPQLNNRFFGNNQPVRIVIDRKLQLQKNFRFFDQTNPSIVINSAEEKREQNTCFYKVKDDADFLQNALSVLYQNGVSAVLVEGGSDLLQVFIDKGLWNKLICITNENLYLENGVPAPILYNALQKEVFNLGNDTIVLFTK